MTNWLRRFTAMVALLAWLASGGEKAFGQANFTAIVPSGTWSVPASWNMGSVPGAIDNVFIGSGLSSTIITTRNESSNNVTVQNSSGLVLGGDLSAGGYLFISNSTLNAQNHNITATTDIFLNDAAARITNRGSLTTNKLTVTGQAFNINPTDTINTVDLINSSTSFVSGARINAIKLTNSTGTTAAVGNITDFITLQTASTLTLTSDMNLSGYIYNVGGTVNAQGHTIAATGYILLNDSSARIINRGNLITNTLSITGQDFDLRATDAVGTYIHNNGAATLASGTTVNTLYLTNSAATARTTIIGTANLSSGTILTVKSGQTTGLTVTDSTVGALTIDATSKLRLEVDGAVNGWVLRWANPAGGNHITDLNTLISAGKIDFTLTNGGHYFVSSNADGFTYVLQPVPEPATTMLIAVGGLASGWVIRRRRLAAAVV